MPPQSPAVPQTWAGRVAGTSATVPPTIEALPSVAWPPPACAVFSCVQWVDVMPPHAPVLQDATTGSATCGCAIVPPATEPAPPV